VEKAAAAAARAAQQISAVGVARSARAFIVKVERMLLVNAQPVTSNPGRHVIPDAVERSPDMWLA
jgi:hypothetical protein